MPKLIAIHGKGGAGKSTVARYVLHRALATGQPVTGFDCDASNGTLSRFHRDHTVRTTGEGEAFMKWVESEILPCAQTGTAVVDLGAGAERTFFEWAASLDLGEVMAEYGIDVTLLCVLNQARDSLVVARAAVTALPTTRHVLVLNHGGSSTRDDFASIKKHSAWDKLTADAKHPIVEVPYLPITMVTLDELNTSFADAAAGAVKDGAARLGPTDRSRLKVWLRTLDAAFAGILP